MSVAGERGDGVVVAGESSARGMELITRSEARGLCLVSCGVGGDVDMELIEGGDAGGGAARGAVLLVSSHTARADGSTGQMDDGNRVGGSCTLLEEVFPIIVFCTRLL